ALDEVQVVRVEAALLEAFLTVERERRRAVEVPPPAVEGADDLSAAERAATDGKLRGPVAARVLVRLDLVRPGAHDEDRVAGHRVLDEVTDVGDLLEPAGQLPHTRPELLVLELEERLVEVALARDERPIGDRVGDVRCIDASPGQ